MRLYKLFFSAVLVITATSLSSQTQEPPNYKPPQGYVPDAATAIKIAVAVWEPIYGAEKIASEKPYVAVLDNGVWTVRGSLPKNWLGGVAEAEVSKDNAKVLRVSHGK